MLGIALCCSVYSIWGFRENVFNDLVILLLKVYINVQIKEQMYDLRKNKCQIFKYDIYEDFKCFL